MFTFELYCMTWDISLGWFLYILQRIATKRSSTAIYSTPVRLYIIDYNCNYTILDWEWCCCRCGSLRSPHWTAIIWSTTLRTLQEFQCMATSITTTQCLCWCHGVIGWCTELVAFGFWHGLCHIFSHVYIHIHIFIFKYTSSIDPSFPHPYHPFIHPLLAWFARHDISPSSAGELQKVFAGDLSLFLLAGRSTLSCTWFWEETAPRWCKMSFLFFEEVGT